MTAWMATTVVTSAPDKIPIILETFIDVCEVQLRKITKVFKRSIGTLQIPKLEWTRYNCCWPLAVTCVIPIICVGSTCFQTVFNWKLISSRHYLMSIKRNSWNFRIWLNPPQIFHHCVFSMIMDVGINIRLWKHQVCYYHGYTSNSPLVLFVKDLTMLNEGNKDWCDKEKTIINGRKISLLGKRITMMLSYKSFSSFNLSNQRSTTKNLSIP